jgi:hypothetical protein
MNTSISRKASARAFAITLVLMSTASLSAQTNTYPFPSTGNVGIGTTTPGETLTVQGNVGLRSSAGTTRMTVAGSESENTISTSGGVPLGFYISGTNYFRINTNGINRFIVTGSGDVGIGTISPSYLLDVRGGMFGVTDGSGNTAVRLRGIGSAGSQRGALELFDSGNLKSVIYSDANDSYINGGGNFGIGTPSPGQKLDVNGNVTSNGYLQVGTDAVVNDRRIYIYSNIARTDRSFGIVSGNADVSSTASVTKYGGYFYTSGPWNGAGSSSVGVYATAAGATNNYAAIFDQGNVGIGTTSPVRRLEVSGSGNSEPVLRLNRSANTDNGLLMLSTAGSEDWLLGNRGIGDNNFRLYSYGTSSDVLTVLKSSGNVGIGKSPDTNYKLDVAGNINATQTITGNSIVAKYQDVAEWVPASEQLSAGTVVVLDSTKSNQVTSSTTGYDTRVAGVVSEQPGISLGEKSEGRVLVATTGRVRVKVDATKSPIHIGDLLVTSDTPGVAMKSEPVNLGGVQFHRPGTLIGKALEPLEKRKGEILVLLSLQ